MKGVDEVASKPLLERRDKFNFPAMLGEYLQDLEVKRAADPNSELVKHAISDLEFFKDNAFEKINGGARLVLFDQVQLMLGLLQQQRNLLKTCDLGYFVNLNSRLGEAYCNHEKVDCREMGCMLKLYKELKSWYQQELNKSVVKFEAHSLFSYSNPCFFIAAGATTAIMATYYMNNPEKRQDAMNFVYSIGTQLVDLTSSFVQLVSTGINTAIGRE